MNRRDLLASSAGLALAARPQDAPAAASDGRRAGLLVFPHPSNFRPSWMHARDYGVLVANPFGRMAFTKGEPSRVEVRPGEAFRLRFAVLAYAGEIDPAALARILRD
jgi:hypothetical protein